MINNIIKRIRLFLHPKRGSYFAFYKILGFFPGNLNLYKEALLHKSSSKERQDGRYLNNERLEFLGDAVLDAIVADLVYRKFRNKNEGFLTNTRSKIVKRETLDMVARNLGLNKVLITSLRTNTQKNHILGNALEALIGAIYLDKGYSVAKKFIDEKVIKPYINIDQIARKEVNFKSKLLEWCQKYRVDLSFTVIENFMDEENNQVFQSQVVLNEIWAGTGTGYSKKESQQQAARMALKKIKSEKEFVERVQALSHYRNEEIEEIEEIERNEGNIEFHFDHDFEPGNYSSEMLINEK
ncbi:ribonuclease 3 [Bacteroidia bacterium]|nr:ribonuclease 3 [Bacteroidia bacterium]